MGTLEAYQLEKWVWSEVDFDVMGWHDASVYSWQLTDHNLVLDIDYIFQWNQPEVEGTPFTFWVAPATLVFPAVRDLEFDFNFFGIQEWQTNAAELEGIEREGEEWVIQFRRGHASFKAEGFTQYIRQTPIFEFGQQIDYQRRGGSSLATFTGQNANNFDFLAFRKSETWRLYQLALDRARIRRHLDELLDKRASGNVELKDFLLQKRDLQDRINYLGLELHNTQFENW